MNNCVPYSSVSYIKSFILTKANLINILHLANLESIPGVWGSKCKHLMIPKQFSLYSFSISFIIFLHYVNFQSLFLWILCGSQKRSSSHKNINLHCDLISCSQLTSSDPGTLWDFQVLLKILKGFLGKELYLWL